MDPIANLREQMEISREIQATWDGCSGDGTLTTSQAVWMADKAARLADLVLALNEWMRKGGFSPWVK